MSDYCIHRAILFNSHTSQFLVSIKKTTPELCSQCDYHYCKHAKIFSVLILMKSI